MEQPPLSQAPLLWIKTVLNDTVKDTDDKLIDIRIRTEKTGDHHTFLYLLGDIRAEYKRRAA